MLGKSTQHGLTAVDKMHLALARSATASMQALCLYSTLVSCVMTVLLGDTAVDMFAGLCTGIVEGGIPDEHGVGPHMPL